MRPRVASPAIETIFETHRSSRAARPLRIALIAHLKYPIAQPYSGGLEMHTHLIARKLTARGHHVTLFASRQSDRSLNTIEICDPTANVPQADEARVEFAAYDDILRRIRSGAFDVVHNNSLHPYPLAKAATLPPMMTVLHTPPFSPLADNAGQCAGPFVAVSESVAHQWVPYVSVFDVVPNGIELDRFAPSGTRVDPPRAIWFGRIVPEKGLHLAIEAAAHASLDLDVAGPIIDRDYWAEVVAPKFRHGIQYLGHLDHATLRWHIARARVALVTPRWEEPFGLVAAEAIATGTPVAAFRRGALPGVIGEAGALAEPDDAFDLARAAREALLIPAEACRQRAQRMLDCSVMINRYEAIYTSLVDPSSAMLAAAE